jgi:O-antigen/teichoic acid export membrane protein
MLAGLAAFTVLGGFDNALAMFLCANDAVRIFALLWLTSVAVGVPLMILFVRTFGVDGVPWALFLSVCWRIIPSAFYCRRVVARLRASA